MHFNASMGLPICGRLKTGKVPCELNFTKILRELRYKGTVKVQNRL